jgi:NAD(P)-dependent dehydrogenase (short-subunit alcohol dehydrogenase family)
MSGPRTALVTGGTRGIGRAIALALADAGCDVIACGRSTAGFDDAAAPAGARIEALACDVTDPAALRALVEHARSTRGGIDALVCAAGSVLRRPVEEIAPDALEALFRVNVFGCFNTISAAVPAMRAGGSIVVIGSTQVDKPMPGMSAYCATKGALEAMVRALAVELGPRGLRINSIRPSLVRSEIWTRSGMDAQQYDALLRTRGAQYPLGRAGEPEDIAGAVLYLTSAAAGWVTGASLAVDGGHALG